MQYENPLALLIILFLTQVDEFVLMINFTCSVEGNAICTRFAIIRLVTGLKKKLAPISQSIPQSKTKTNRNSLTTHFAALCMRRLHVCFEF